jgi:peptidoglycan/LPS O-acetylase OafA/YrhL
VAERRTDWASLVAGLLFLGLAVAFVMRGTGEWEFNVLWVLPVLLAGLVAAAAARALTRPRRSRPSTENRSDTRE